MSARRDGIARCEPSRPKVWQSFHSCAWHSFPQRRCPCRARDTFREKKGKLFFAILLSLCLSSLTPPRFLFSPSSVTSRGRNETSRRDSKGTSMERPAPGPLSHAMGEEADRRKLWLALCGAELAVIVILATAMGYLWTHKEESRELAGRVDGMSQALRAAAQNWTACQNQTRRLAANSSALRSEAAQLTARLQQQEQENKLLKGELAVLQNWTLRLEDLANHQKEIIASLRYQSKAFSGARRNGPPLLVLLLAVARHV